MEINKVGCKDEAKDSQLKAGSHYSVNLLQTAIDSFQLENFISFLQQPTMAYPTATSVNKPLRV